MFAIIINRPYQAHFCPNWPITRFTLSNTRLNAYISTAFRLSSTSNIFSVRSNHVCYWPSQLTDVLYYGRRNSLLYYGSWNHSANQIKCLDLALDSLSCLPNQSTRVGQLAVFYITLSVYLARELNCKNIFFFNYELIRLAKTISCQYYLGHFFMYYTKK